MYDRAWELHKQRIAVSKGSRCKRWRWSQSNYLFALMSWGRFFGTWGRWSIWGRRGLRRLLLCQRIWSINDLISSLSMIVWRNVLDLEITLIQPASWDIPLMTVVARDCKQSAKHDIIMTALLTRYDKPGVGYCHDSSHSHKICPQSVMEITSR